MYKTPLLALKPGYGFSSIKTYFSPIKFALIALKIGYDLICAENQAWPSKFLFKSLRPYILGKSSENENEKDGIHVETLKRLKNQQAE